MTDEEIVKYALWVIHSCDSPVSEIEWLVNLCLNNTDSHNVITEEVKHLLKQIKD